jgi:tetratricopeptide (TPR) repeat protein
MNQTMPDPRPEYRLGDSDELEEHVAMLRVCTEQFGPCHPRTLNAAKSLAAAFWLAGYADRAVGLLDQALDFAASTLRGEHPIRIDLLSTLGKILFEQRHLEGALAIRREVMEYCVRHSGPNHPSSLEASGDLAAILYELGQDEEAAQLEREALEGARAHLAKTHPVTSVLAWNCAVSHERRGDLDSARSIIVSELSWLLVAEPFYFEPDQETIRTFLERRLNLAGASAC